MQFERNTKFFNISGTIKKEIDIVVYNETERFAIELKYPLNGQYPEQMYSFVKDIKFMEEVKEKGFTQTYVVALVKDKPFYEGNNNNGIYSIFRDRFFVSDKIFKPTGNFKNKEFVQINGSYKFEWIDCMVNHKYYCIRL